MVVEGSTHSTQQDVHIIKVKDRVWSLIETRKQVRPYDFNGRCDLLANPRNNEILTPTL